MRKVGLSTIIGLAKFVIFTILMFADMYYSTKTNYDFHLEWWHLGLGYFTSFVLMLLPEELIIKKITAVFERLVGKIK